MRKYRLLSLILLPLFTISCNSWLDVKPEDEIDETDLFSTGAGYRHALNGIYFGMGDGSLYGENLTWGIVDALGQCYDYTKTHSSTTGHLSKYGASAYQWENYQLKPKIESMWENAYKTVANCNNLIQNIENDDPEKFTYKTREKAMIWGEALALRAFIQLDVLRLFAASPSTNPGDNVYIPYISQYPSYVSKRLTVDSCMNSIIRDLTNARKLLWKADSGQSFSTSKRFESISLGEEFFMNYKRGYRLNYYAATALLARACLYAQKTDDAYAYAKEVVDYQAKNKYFNYDNSDGSKGNIKFYSDIIWGLESVDLIVYVNVINNLTDPKPSNQYYLQVLNAKESFFGADLSSGVCNDNRYKYWLYNLGSGSNFRFVKYEKYDSKDTKPKISNSLVPMVRMSELYYIAAEAVYKRDLEEAKGYLRTVKKGRGLTSDDASMKDVENVSASSFMDVLINDARREWLGEGQIFFMYKRLNKMIPEVNGNLIPIDAAHTILPIPDSETNIN